jgi:PKD domain
MVLRRELLPIALAAAILLIGAGQAFAAPQWLPSEPLPSSFAVTTDPAVATDADGNSIAVWIDQGQTPVEVRAVYRPRGGPWETTTVNLEPAFSVITGTPPRAVALPDGSFVVVWSANRKGDADPVLRSATRSPAGVWTTELVRAVSGATEIDGLEAGGDGSVMVVSVDTEGGSVSNTKPSASAPWGAPQTVGIGTVADVAVGPDGGAVAVSTGGVCSGSPCIQASHRPPGGDWGLPETVGITTGVVVQGLAVTANPNGSATAAWAVATFNGEGTGPPGDVLSADRTSGGSWTAVPDSVAHLENDSPNCGDLHCLDIATGADGAQLAVWPQNGQSGDEIAAGVRSAGGAWTGPETVSGTVRGNLTSPQAAITTSGVPVVAWSSSANNFANANGSHRDGGGTWHPVLLGSSQDDSVNLGDLDADGDGNALTAFRDRDGVFAAGFDGGGPRFDSFSAPSTGTVGATLAFAATADDNWSGVSGISWLFGDGGAGVGGAVNHAYAAAGGFTAAATATDGIGNTSQASAPVSVTAAATPTPTPTPTPNPCGTADRDQDGIGDACDTNDGSKRPVAFKTVNATVVSGDVFVKLPAGAARAAAAKPPKGFVRLRGAETIPVGATLDTAHGRVLLRSASDTRKHVQLGQFFRGRFVVRQFRQPRGKAKRRSTKLITELRLSGSSFSKACRATASASAKRRSKKRVRRLFGDGKGAFRTRGRNAAATVRGTRWGVQDRCDGTLVTVQRGRVSVRDLVRHRTVTVTTGHTYLARRR